MQKGSMELNTLMRKYAKLVYKLAYSRTQNHADAEDIFQEVFLRLAQRSEPFQSEEHEKAWLIRVTANLSTNLIASAWRRKVTLREFLPEHRNIPAADEEKPAIDIAMKMLPERERTALYLRYGEGMKAEEIANYLDESVHAVRKRITRAKKKLGRQMAELEKEDADDVWNRI
ncbi:MAG: RNA polymerase sigma factor [Clostridia bacterium]|nr:RNA polymerase sigma factor [Clostridia bacterium]